MSRPRKFVDPSNGPPHLFVQVLGLPCLVVSSQCSFLALTPALAHVAGKAGASAPESRMIVTGSSCSSSARLDLKECEHCNAARRKPKRRHLSEHLRPSHPAERPHKPMGTSRISTLKEGENPAFSRETKLWTERAQTWVLAWFVRIRDKRDKSSHGARAARKSATLCAITVRSRQETPNSV